MQKETLEKLRAKMLAGTPRERYVAANNLVQRGAEGLGVLIEALAYDDEEVQGLACRSLARLGSVARRAAPALVGLLQGTEAMLRAEALDALYHISPKLMWALPEIEACLQHEHVWVKSAAMRLLGRMGKRAAPTASRLKSFLITSTEAKPKEIFLALSACSALKEMGEADTQVFKTLVLILRHCHETSAIMAAKLLAKLSEPGLEAELLRASWTGLASVRHHARQGLEWRQRRQRR